MQSWGVRLTWFDCKLNIKQSSDPSHPALSLPADVRWGRNEWQTNPNRRLRGGYPALLPWIRQSQFWCRYFLRPQTLDESPSARIASSRRAAWGQRNKDWAGRKTKGWGLGEGGRESYLSLPLPFFLVSPFKTLQAKNHSGLFFHFCFWLRYQPWILFS